MQHPGMDLVGLGMSMGGAILAKYASKTSEKCLFKALVTVAAPFNFLTSAEGIRDKWNGLFDSMLLAVLKGFINNKRKELEKFEKEFKDLGIDFEQVLQSKSCCEFDDRFTAKMMGLKSYKEYYLKGSCVGQMHRISIPFLALHAKDDPIVSYLAAPQEEFRKSKNMVLALTTTGGHVGFFKGNCPPKRWFQVPCVEFLLNSLDSV
jgi:predicted alpha/beta-fold hydrolase